MRRRALLGALASGVGLAGCLGGNAGFETDTPPRTSPPTTTYGRTEPGTAYRCQGPPVTVDRTITDDRGYDDNLNYFPRNGTIKVVAGRSDGEPAWFETRSFEEWGTVQCARLGRDRVQSVTAERLNSRRFDAAATQPPAGATAQSPVVVLSVTTHVRPNGGRITPAVSLRWLADLAPRAADVTVTLDGRSFSRTVPVYAAHETIEQE